MSGGRVPGPELFVRYAYPPNALGYCGPADSAALRAGWSAGPAGPDPVELARSFTGAWPYLELLADRAGIADPLDHRVVEAYWVGNRLLHSARLTDLADPAGERFRRRLGLPGGCLAGSLAHHSFHVLCVYPWAGMLGDPRRTGHALNVLEQCRIGWGRLTAVDGDRLSVRSRPLAWDGGRLALAGPVTRPVRPPVSGWAGPAAVGDWVSLHWDWVCDRLSEGQVRALRSSTRHHLELVNRRR